ncbi:helix-turn-helix domain-containing protein [Rhizosphaericola mali]|uniref:Helix-turn-helix transcriptional regulator n=1 Tax=Rhizosphaericola mali TaxID=2545455 RepID=A0A5P2FY49_9BACT|nr:AraC family transcriptional regulator [Rhizosphaericola mali]QES87867.1 helix-turn-helix transcriptional regulator [Rhizosphaericola mali]
MNSTEKIQETLSYYKILCNKPYYISTGNPLTSFPNKPFRMDYYAVCTCTEGYIELLINNERYVIHGQDVLLSAPSTVVQFVRMSDDFSLKLLFFDKNFLLKNMSNPYIIEKFNLFQSGSYSLFKLSTCEYQTILNLLTYLGKKAASKGKFTNEILRSIIFNILLELAEILQSIPKPATIFTNNDLFIKFLELVQFNFKEYKNVDFYTKSLCISNKYLIEIIKKNTGKTPHECIDEMLLKEAVVQLGNPSCSISEIAYDLNFQSVASFSRFFKKKTNMSPKNYRNKI